VHSARARVSRLSAVVLSTQTENYKNRMLRALLLAACLAAVSAQGYKYTEPKCPLVYAKTTYVQKYQTQLKTEYTTSVVPVYSTSYVTRTKVVPTYVTRQVVRTQYVPQVVERTATSTYVNQQVVTSTVKYPDTTRTNTVYRTQTRYRTVYKTQVQYRTEYVPTTIYRQVAKTEYVQKSVQVPRYVTETKVRTVRGPASTIVESSYYTSVYTSTRVLPAQTVYRTQTQIKVQEVVSTVYAPAVVITKTNTQQVYRTRYVTDTQVVPRYTTVAVPVYVTSTRTEYAARTQYITSTEVKYTTVYQPQTQYVTSQRYVPTTRYVEATKVVRVTDTPQTQYRTLPVYVTSTKQLPDQLNTVYATKTQQQVVKSVYVVTRPEYKEVLVTKTVEGKCGYSYPEPAKRFEY